MGFESVLAEQMIGREFGRNRYLATLRERPHMARSGLLANDNAEFVGLGEEKRMSYSGWTGKRYVAAENLTYDFIVSFYDPDSRRVSVRRLFGPREPAMELRAGLEAAMLSGPEVEARVIGLQDGEDHGFLVRLVDLLLKNGVGLVEADLFGRDVRHIAIDLKTGESYNLLLEDRNYRPGELVNRMTAEDFQRVLMLHPRA